MVDSASDTLACDDDRTNDTVRAEKVIRSEEVNIDKEWYLTNWYEEGYLCNRTQNHQA